MNKLTQYHYVMQYNKLEEAQTESYNKKLKTIREVASAISYDLTNYDKILNKELQVKWTNSDKRKLNEIINNMKNYIVKQNESNENPNHSINIRNDINNSNNVAIQNNFQAIYDNSLIDEEIKDKLKEIENILNELSNESKKSKWDKIKNKISWFIEKGFDVFSTIVPLIIKQME